MGNEQSFTPRNKIPISKNKKDLNENPNEIFWKWNSSSDPNNKNMAEWSKYLKEDAKRIEKAYLIYKDGQHPEFDINENYKINFAFMLQISKQDPNKQRNVIREIKPRPNIEGELKNLRTAKKTTFLDLVKNQQSLSALIRDYDLFVRKNLLNQDQPDWNGIVSEICKGLEFEAKRKETIEKYAPYKYNTNDQANKAINELKKSTTIPEFFNNLIKVYTDETFIYREMNIFMLNYEDFKQNRKELYLEKFHGFGSFAWTLDQILKLTPQSTNNIWSAKEEIHSSVDKYVLYRGVFLPPEILKEYEDAHLGSIIEKKIVASFANLFQMNELVQIFNGIQDQQNILYWEGFSSATDDIYVLDKFNANVHFYMRACSIKDEHTQIASLDRTNLKSLREKSIRKEENEVLLPPGITFKIDKIQHVSEKLTKIFITLNPECDFISLNQENLIGVRKSEYLSQTNHYYKICLNFLQDSLNSEDVNLSKETLIYVKRCQKIVFCSNKPLKKEKNITFKQEGVINMKFLKRVDILNERISIFFEGNKKVIKIRCHLSVGDIFIPFYAKKMFEGKAKIKIDKHPQKNFIILFWSIIHTQKNDLMKNIFNILKETKIVLTKDIIIAVNIEDDSILDLTKKIPHPNFEFFNSPQIWDDIPMFCNPENIEVYGDMQRGPRILMIDKNARILFNDFERNFGLCEKLLNSEKMDFQKTIKIEKPTISRKNYKIIKEFLSKEDGEFYNEIREIQQKIPYNFEFDIRLTKCKPIGNISERTPKIYKNLEADYHTVLRNQDWIILSKFLEKYKINITEKNEPTIIKTISLEQGSKCSSCNTDLLKLDPQYFCRVCNRCYCKKCGEEIDPHKQGNSKYIDIHNLVYIHLSDGGVPELIDEYKLGNNKEFKDNITEFGASCNICHQEITKNIRWICLNCRPGPMKRNGFVDICSGCMDVLQCKDGSEKKTMFLDLLEKEDNHDKNTHVFLRVCFGDSYKDY